MLLLNFFRFIFRFRPKISCIFIFRLFFGRKTKFHIRLFYFSAEKEKNHFRSTSKKHANEDHRLSQASKHIGDIMLTETEWFHVCFQPQR